jgi:filamentous hemagglutinin
VANRRITQFPTIQPGDINDQDVLNLVHVFEVDPALRNKKFSFAQLRTYLDQYYINTAEFDPLEAGNVIVSGYVIVSGEGFFGSTLNVTGDTSFSSNVTITGNLNVSGDIELDGDLDVDDIDAVQITTNELEVQVSGFIATLSGNTINATSGTFTRLFAVEATGIDSNFVSGTFNRLVADSLDVDVIDVSGIIVTGEILSSGTIQANDINVTGTLSGATITGDVVNVGDLNVSAGNFDYISGITITGDQVQIQSGAFTTMTGDTEIVSGHFRTLTGETLTGNTANILDLNTTDLFVESGYFNNAVASGIYVDTVTGRVAQFETLYVSGDATVTGNFNVSGDFVVDDITADHIVANSGTLGTGIVEFLSGQTITGDAGQFTQLNVVNLNASGIEFSGEQTISGDFTVLSGLFISGNAYYASGLTVSGATSGLSAHYNNFTANEAEIDNLQVQYIWVSGDTVVSGDTNISGNLDVDGTIDVTGVITNYSGIVTSGDLIVGPSGDFIVSGESIFVQSGVFKENTFFDKNVTITGDLNVSGDVVVASGITLTGDIQADNITATGNLNVYNDATISGNVLTSGDLTVSGATILRGDTNLYGNLTLTTGNIATNGSITASSNITSSGNISGVNVYASTTITGDTVNFNLASGVSGIVTSLQAQDTRVSGLVISGNAEVSGAITVIGSGNFNGTVTGETADFTYVYGRNTVSGANLSGNTASIQSGNFGDVGIETLNVYTEFNVPFGTVADPGLGFNNPAVTGVFDGICVESVTGQYNTMTFVNQNASGMTLSSGSNGFILTIWGS